MTKDVDPHDETRAGPEPAAPAAKTPTVIGSYELRDILGEGGMGVVWRAHDPNLDREIAIKVIKRMDAPVSLRQRLQREARAMARLKHPNVLTVYDSGTEGGRDFIAMELVDGCSVDVWLDRAPLPEDVIAAVLAAGRGLAAAHRAGLVHRDFKPHNILRSNDGRVLVTDFGLARGLGDASVDESHAGPTPLEISLDQTMDASASGSGTRSSRPKADSVLDSPLTQTGVLIGTPAYMAPEQFEGAPPDPRTDQFAFCVTAWQMLTGARPYHGNSLDELRKAAGEGVGNVKSSLAPPIRAALVRGMDPDPAKRWQDMDALLDELERLTKPKRPFWIMPAVIFVTLFAFVLVGAIVRRMSRGTASEARVCEAADVAFGDAWSPAVRGQVWKELSGVSESAFARVADPFDAWRTAWMQSYDEACRVAPDKLPRARLNCLLSARDLVGALQLVLRKGGAQLYEGFDAHGVLPNIAVCTGPNPVSAPQIPIESRARILDVMARSFTLQMQPDVTLAATELLAEAKPLGWPSLAPIIMLSQANALMQRDQVAAAREVYAAGAKLAKTDIRLLASLRTGLLESALEELAKPDTPIRSGEVPAEIAGLVEGARSTARSAGNDPLLMAAISSLEGRALGMRARWSFDKRLYTEALAAVQEARRLFGEIGDVRRAAIVAAQEGELYLQRADERALDDATFVARSAEEALDRAKLPPARVLDEIQGRIAFARGEYGETRARFAKLGGAMPSPDAPAVTGKVVDMEGKPVGEATVIAWTGTLDGDPVNLVTDMRSVAELGGEIVQTASDGTFTIHAAKDAAIVAQRGPLRTAPQPIGDHLTLRLGATTVIGGRVDGRFLGGVVAFAQLAAGDARWRIRAPVHRDATYAIGGLPAAPSMIGATAQRDDGVRTEMAVGQPPRLTWRHGRAVEVIVRGELRDGAQVWVLPGGVTRETPKTRGEIDRLVETATAFATAAPHPIGATATPAGLELYHRGDHHAVIIGNPPTSITVCGAADDQPATAVTCVETEMHAGEVTDFPDGRWGTDTQAVLIELH